MPSSLVRIDAGETCRSPRLAKLSVTDGRLQALVDPADQVASMVPTGALGQQVYDPTLFDQTSLFEEGCERDFTADVKHRLSRGNIFAETSTFRRSC